MAASFWLLITFPPPFPFLCLPPYSASSLTPISSRVSHVQLLRLPSPSSRSLPDVFQHVQLVCPADAETPRPHGTSLCPADIRHPGAQGPSSPSLIGPDSKYVPWNWLGTHERKCASTCCATRWREEWRRGGRTERRRAWQRSREKMKTWVQLGEQIWRCLTGFHTSVAYCRHYYNVAFGHFDRWLHCGAAEEKQRTDKKWLSWMSYGTEGGSLWIKLWSYSRFPLFIFLSKWEWLPAVSSCTRKAWLTFIWTCEDGCGAANDTFLLFLTACLGCWIVFEKGLECKIVKKKTK